MPLRQKIIVYLIGVAIGIVILTLIPRQPREGREHPWHAQTAPEGYYPLSLTDYWNRPVEIHRQPRYFISLAPSVTETLFAMDLGDHLIAVTRWCAWPQTAREMRDLGAHIGNMDQPDMEMIAGYRPDLVIGSQHTPAEVYGRIHHPPRTHAVALSFDSLNDMYASIATIGRVTGVPGHAVRLINTLREREEQVRAAASRLDPAPKVLFLLDIEDDLKPGWTAGGGTWVDDLILAAGGTNISADVGQNWGRMQFESVVKGQPDLIIIKDGDSERDRQRLRQLLGRLASHPVWSEVPAVSNHQIHLVDSGYINIPGPRTWDAMERFAEVIQEMK